MKLAYLDTELGADLDGAVAVVDCKIIYHTAAATMV